MKPVDDPASLAGKLEGTGSLVAVENTGQMTLLSLVYKLKGATAFNPLTSPSMPATSTSPRARC